MFIYDTFRDQLLKRSAQKAMFAKKAFNIRGTDNIGMHPDTGIFIANSKSEAIKEFKKHYPHTKKIYDVREVIRVKEGEGDYCAICGKKDVKNHGGVCSKECQLKLKNGGGITHIHPRYGV